MCNKHIRGGLQTKKLHEQRKGWGGKLGQGEKGVERCRGKKEKARDNKSGVNESQPAAQTDSQLSWRVTEFLQSRTEQTTEGRREGGGVLINKVVSLDGTSSAPVKPV